MRHDEREEHRSTKPRSVKGLILTYAPPWLGWLLLAPAAVALYLIWGRHGGTPTTLVAVGLAASTLMVVKFTDRMARGRSEPVRQLAMATSAAGGLWLFFSLLFSPWADPWRSLWLLGGPTICVMWTVRRALLSSKGEEAGTGAAAKLLEVLNGARVSKVRTEDTRLGQIVHANAEVNRGEQTVKDLQGMAEHIEAIAGLRRGSVMITPHPTDAGRGNMLIIPTDTLSGEVLYRGPSRPGASIAEPIELGVYLDGKPMEITLPGDAKKHRNLAHILTNGVTGAGKSEMVRQMMAKVLCRTEVCVVASDPVKGTQTLGVFVETGALELVSLDLASSKAMLTAVKRSIPARGRFLGDHGFKQWEPGCGLTFLIVWLEEATWATQSGVLTDIAAQARSVGIMLLVSQQRSSYASTDTDLRANLTAGISGGLSAAADAKFNLSDDLVDMVGDTLESWKANKPGYMIAQHPSIPEADQVKPWRSEYAEDDQLRADLLEWVHVRSPMDEVTRAAFGKTYDQIKAIMAGQPPDQAIGESGSSAGGFDDEDNEAWDSDLADDGAEDEQEEDVDDDAGPDMNTDPRRPTPRVLDDLTDMPFGVPAPSGKLTPEQARKVVQYHLRALLDAGVTKVTPADIARMKPDTTQSREWVRRELHRLEASPEPGEISLIRDADPPKPGTFDIIAPAFADAAP
jgi:hypothetical protein